MPSPTSAVGGLTLPVPVPAANLAFTDPAVNGLARYLAWCLRFDLNAKLLSIDGVASDACPEANVYPWDPATQFVRQNLPALYMWWPGESKWERETVLYRKRTRSLHACYFFEEVVSPGGRSARAGVLAAVDASFAKAADRDGYPTYAPVGAAAGASVREALGLRDWLYDGSQRVTLEAEIPHASAQPGGAQEGHVSRGFPALLAKFTIVERIAGETLVSPDDDFDSATFDIQTNDEDDPAGPVTILDRLVEND